IQDKAREVRFQYIEQIISARRIDFIATGHHRDDLSETFFLKLNNAAGLAALGNYGVTSSLQRFPQQVFLKPLFFFTKKDILKIAALYNIPYFNDSSNFTNDYRRNIIRNEIFPFINQRLQYFQSNMLKSFSFINTASSLLFKAGRQAGYFLFYKELILLLPDYYGLNREEMALFLTILCARFFPQKRMSSGELKEITAKISRRRNARLFNYCGRSVVINYNLIYLYTPANISLLSLPSGSSVTGTGLAATLKQLPESRPVPDNRSEDDFYFSSTQKQVKLQLGPRQQSDFLQVSSSGPKKKISKILIKRKVPWFMRDKSIMVREHESGRTIGFFILRDKYTAFLKQHNIINFPMQYIDVNYRLSHNKYKYCITMKNK
ncbi:MAG TPA: tRNA lysidine(34) synthetase TilS, partial [Spirochaetota bacterium]|nr:tRNA lysidine(34) synthetase TilS [Spirochaetota bacterium]